MTEIPVTTKEFRRWCKARSDAWPEHLRNKGQTALLTLDQIDGAPPHVMNAMPETAPKTFASMAKDLTDFAEAYGSWKANSAS